MKLWNVNLTQKNNKFAFSFLLSVLMMFSVGFSPAANHTETHNVRVNADGYTFTFESNRQNPYLLLAKAGVKLGEYDDYSVNIMGNNDIDINVVRAIPVLIECQGESKRIMTTKQIVGDVLAESGYDMSLFEIDNMDINSPIKSNLRISLKENVPEPMCEEYISQINTSAGSENYRAVYVMEACAYLPSDGGGGGRTATGMIAGRGVAAVDPNVIPLGSRLYITGYGEAIAADVGGAIRGNTIDLCVESYDEAIQFGRREVTVYVLE